MFRLGSKVLVNGSHDGYDFNNMEAYIFRIDPQYESDEDTILLYMPSWSEKHSGHGQAWEEWINNRAFFPFEPDEHKGSWNVPREWLTDGNITLIESLTNTLGPHWKVIRKIKEMNKRRKDLGYAL